MGWEVLEAEMFIINIDLLLPRYIFMVNNIIWILIVD